LQVNGRSLLVGLTGGIATGKSVVASMLEELGAPIVDFDLLARLVVEPDKPAWQDIVEHFGENILYNDRTIDRKRLGEIVFNDPDQRRRLESFTHPRIREEFDRQIAAIRDREPTAIVQAVVPLLIESGMQSLFDHVVVVHVSEETQIERLMARDGLSRDGAIARVRSQLPIDDKAAFADTVIDNSGTLAETRHQVDELWQRLREMQQESP